MNKSKSSLIFNLVLMFALSSAILLILLALSGEYILKREFRREQERTLDDTVALLQSICRQDKNLADLVKREIPRDLQALHFHVYHVKIEDQQGRVWVESPRFPALPKSQLEQLPTVEEGHPGDGNLVDLDNRQFLVVQAWASHPSRQRPGAVPQTVRLKLLVALETTRLQQTLASYQRMLLLMVLVGVFFSTGLAYVIARRGLRPLRRMTDMVRGLQVANLQPQFSAQPWPEELLPLGLEFDRLLTQIQYGLERLSHFSGNLAHELRTPLTSMMLETDVVLSQSRTREEYVELLASNMEELERLSSLIERLLLLTKTESSSTKSVLVEIPVLERIQRLVDYHWESVPSKDVSLSIPPELVVQSDPRLFEMAAGNLLSNALKYGQAPYQIRYAARDGQTILSVIDSGPGISDEHLPFIFDRLYRVDAARPGTDGWALD